MPKADTQEFARLLRDMQAERVARRQSKRNAARASNALLSSTKARVAAQRWNLGSNSRTPIQVGQDLMGAKRVHGPSGAPDRSSEAKTPGACEPSHMSMRQNVVH